MNKACPIQKAVVYLIYQNGGATGQGHKKKMTNANNTIEFKASKNFEVGAILVDSWGWEQTNVDFYAIVKRSGMFVTIVKLKKDTTPGAALSMTTHETPSQEIDTTEKPMRKKVKVFNGEERGFSLRDYAGGGWVDLWKGEAETATHYA